MEFRVRNYIAEEAACVLPRVPATNDHPLSRPLHSTSTILSTIPNKSSRSLLQTDGVDHGQSAFVDPLRSLTADHMVSDLDVDYVPNALRRRFANEAAEVSIKEWTSFKRSLMQKFAVTKTVSVSTNSEIIIRNANASGKSLTTIHLEELDDPQKTADEEVKIIARQEYVSRLHELRDEIGQAWRADDRVTALRLSIKVARLLLDTSLLQFYPTLFILVTDVMDTLGDLVWERIKRKAEYSDDGILICSLPENFETKDVRSDAKETCNNWFCKIGSIRDLLPRIYLEMAILRCWRFLQDNSLHVAQRLSTMIRGLADPLASAYCCLYLARCAKTFLQCDAGFLTASIKDITVLLTKITSGKEASHRNSAENRKLLISLIEPTIEWIMKCIFKDAKQSTLGDILVELGLQRDLSVMTRTVSQISVVIHYLVKELPAEIVSINSLKIAELFETSNDMSLNQYLNYRLLGFKLCETSSPIESLDAVLDKVFQVVTHYDLEEYLKVVSVYLDIVLQYHMDNHLSFILHEVSKRVSNKKVSESELESLQSMLMKLLSHFNDLEDLLALNHFVNILDVMHGSLRAMVDMHILTKAMRKGYLHDPTTIEWLFEISQALHDNIDFLSIEDNHQQPSHLISRFVQMVDFGSDVERHLTFAIECRAAFSRINELKETLVHMSNHLAVKAMKDFKFHGFIKSCIAFNEVTLPSVPDGVTRMNLSLETAEVALLGGLVSHTEGLIIAALSCLQCLGQHDGFKIMLNMEVVLSTIRKLCSFLVIVPGNLEQGIDHISKSMISLINSQSWITPTLRAKTFCAILSLLAALSQNELPYHASNKEVMGSEELFFGDQSYSQQLASISTSLFRSIVDILLQEPSPVARGNSALEVCSCIKLNFRENEEVSVTCSKLIEIAKSSLPANDKYLKNMLDFFDQHTSTFATTGSASAA